jgi:hypothetical protein
MGALQLAQTSSRTQAPARVLSARTAQTSPLSTGSATQRSSAAPGVSSNTLTAAPARVPVMAPEPLARSSEPAAQSLKPGRAAEVFPLPTSAPTSRAAHATHTQPSRLAPRSEAMPQAQSPEAVQPLQTPQPGAPGLQPRLASALQQEVRALDGVRRALQGGRAGQALRLLDAYRDHFRSGVLKPEAAVLEVQALLETGDRRRAMVVADRVLASGPTSQHAKIVRALLGQTHNP